MPRKTKAQYQTQLFRTQTVEILKDASWIDEGVREWLQKELRREPGYIYSEKEHNALRRIVAASTSFEGWDGYTVQQLAVAAARYMADHGYDDEMFLKRLLSSGVKKLRLNEMGWLVRLARAAGEDLTRFDPEVELYDQAA